MTTISVVIPVWNDARFLADALAALSRQRRPADEVIVVDNASTDTTASVAAAAGARVILEPVRGIWPAAAAGYDAASSTVIARLDADSVPPDDWLLRIASAFDTHDLDAVTGPGRFYDCGRIEAFLGEKLYIGGYFWAMGGWLGHPPLFGSNFAMTRELWRAVRDAVHRTRTDVHDDLDLSLHLGTGARIRYDADLWVGVSARPFESWDGFRRRMRWASTTLRLHYPDDSPVRRRIERRRRGLAPITR
ncbi:MAG TPA: glycosyltransferase family 2 protein [Glaciibacter sp.]|nr:glycosyltransferase family 2 protein [Glaciibacter sp.]